MEIFGLNIASSSQDPNERGWIDPRTRKFVYLPIEETFETNPPAPTFAELGFSTLKFPHHQVHVDPEFDTYTYGHVARFGDSCLWRMKRGDVLFFFATLDLLPHLRNWGLYILGHFFVSRVLDTRGMNQDEIRNLKGFENNAHARQTKRVVQLLVKGNRKSRLYKRAIPLFGSSRQSLSSSRFCWSTDHCHWTTNSREDLAQMASSFS